MRIRVALFILQTFLVCSFLSVGLPGESAAQVKKPKASAKKVSTKKDSTKKVSSKNTKKAAPAKKAATPAKKVEPSPKASPTTVDSSTTAEANKSEERKAEDKSPEKASKPKNGNGSALSSAVGKQDNSAPVFITSESLKLDARERIFTYYDNVKVVRGDTTILADKVTGRYNEANEIERALCEKNVVITRGDTMKATSNRADYDVKRGVIVMTESPELNDKGSVLNADKVTVYVNEDRSEAEGHVRVKVLKTDQGGK